MSTMSVSKLTVIAVSDEKQKLANLVHVLKQHDCRILVELNSTADLCLQAARYQADIIVIDMSLPGQAELNAFSQLHYETPTPLLMYAQRDDSAFISDVVQAGVHGYILQPLTESRLDTNIHLAMARFKGTQALLNEVVRMKEQIQERKVIEKAKGLIMKNQGCDEPAAYQALRKLAMDRSQRIFDVAKNVISVMDLMKTV